MFSTVIAFINLIMDFKKNLQKQLKMSCQSEKKLSTN